MSLLKELEDEWRAGHPRKYDDARMNSPSVGGLLAPLEEEELVERVHGAFRVTLWGLLQMAEKQGPDDPYFAEYEIAARVVDYVRGVLSRGDEACFSVDALAKTIDASPDAITRSLFRIGMRRAGKDTFGPRTTFVDSSDGEVEFSNSFLLREPIPVELGPANRVVELEVKSLRAVRHARIELGEPGITLLTGPSGSGKSTVAAAFAFIQNLAPLGVLEAARVFGSRSQLARSIDEPPQLSLRVGRVRWSLSLRTGDALFDPVAGETIDVGKERWVELDAGASHGLVLGKREASGARPFLRDLLDSRRVAPELLLLAVSLGSLRSHPHFVVSRIRERGVSNIPNDVLARDGSNLLFVLARWAQRARTDGSRRAWVVEVMRNAFPSFEDIECEVEGEDVRSWFFRRGDGDRRFSFTNLSDGEIAALAILTAVAGASRHAVVVFDEIENHLHPHALRTLIRAIRARAEAEQLRVLAVTHSPVALDELRSTPERVLVMEPDRSPVPTRLTDLHDAEWLAHFSLGSLYGDEFGRQVPASHGDGSDDAHPPRDDR